MLWTEIFSGKWSPIMPTQIILDDISKELNFFDPFDLETLKTAVSPMARRYRP